MKKHPSEAMVFPSHPTNMHLKLLEVGTAAFPKLWKYTFAFLLYSSTKPSSWLEESGPYLAGLYVLYVSSIASLKFLEKFTSINQVVKLGSQQTYGIHY